MRSKKYETFARIPHGWYVVDKVAGTPHDGHPWFIGTGIGFDINRILVYARNESDAMEISEEKWPDLVGSRVNRRDESKVEESGQGTFFSKGRMYTYKESRIFTVASKVERGTPLPGSEAELKSGQTIRYA